MTIRTSRHNRLKTLFTLAIVVVGCAALFTPASGASVRQGQSASCGSVAFAPQSDDLAFNIRTAGVPCSMGRAVAAASRPASLRPGPSRSYEADQFRCHGSFVQPQGKDYERYRCQRGSSRVVFDRG